MPTNARLPLVLFVAFAANVTELFAESETADRPLPVAPARKLNQAERDQREALKLFGVGLMLERENRLLEALRSFEEALKLDPKAVPLYKAVLPLYLAMDRGSDALAACAKILELNSGDHATWYLSARIHKEQGKPDQAIAALKQVLQCVSLREHPDLHFQAAADLGSMQEDAKDHAGALASYEEAVQILDNPTHLLELEMLSSEKAIAARSADMHERIGLLCLECKKFDLALEAFDRARKKVPEAAGRMNYQMARVRFAQERYKDALRHLDDYLDTQPQSTEPYEMKIAMLRKMGKNADIIPALKQYAERDAFNLSLQMLLANQYVKERRWAEADARYREIAKTSPSAEVYQGLFGLYKKQGSAKVGDVLELLDSTLAEASPHGDRRPNDSAVLRARAMLQAIREDAKLVEMILPIALRDLGVRERAGETWHFLAVLASRTRQLDKAEKLYRQCLTHVQRDNEHEIYGGLMQVLWEERKLEDVVQVARNGLKDAQNANRLLFHHNLARALAQLDKIDDALVETDQAINLAQDRNRLEFRLLRARILTLGEQYEKAEEECLSLLKEAADPGEVRKVRYSLSGIYSAAHKTAKAEEQLQTILEADPNDDSANNDLGYIWADQGKNLEEAEKMIRKAIQLDREQKKKATRDEAGKEANLGVEHDKDNAAFVDSLGWTLFRRGRFDEARKELERAVKLPEGDDPVIWDHLGDVCLRLDDSAKARAAWQKALKLYEEDKRRKMNDQYRELKNKLRLLDQATQR